MLSDLSDTFKKSPMRRVVFFTATRRSCLVPAHGRLVQATLHPSLTGGHPLLAHASWLVQVDNFACFARPGMVLLAWTDDESDPQVGRPALF